MYCCHGKLVCVCIFRQRSPGGDCVLRIVHIYWLGGHVFSPLLAVSSCTLFCMVIISDAQDAQVVITLSTHRGMARLSWPAQLTVIQWLGSWEVIYLTEGWPG